MLLTFVTVPRSPGQLKSGDLDALRKLLDRLAAVDRARAPKFMPDVITGQWVHGDPDARRKIEDRLPKKSN